MTRSTRRWILVIAAALLIPAGAPGQARKIKRIERPDVRSAEPVDPLEALELPTSRQCEGSVFEIAAGYGTDELEDLLHADFPNRSDLLDVLRRATLHAAHIQLYVEAIEGTRFTPVATTTTLEGTVRVTDCVADVRTRLLFDDPETGERVTSGPGRAQWRIRFELPADAGEGRS